MGENTEASDIAEITGQNPTPSPEGEGQAPPEGGEQPPSEVVAAEGENFKPDELKPTTPKWMKDRIDRATRQRGEAERTAAAEKARADKAEENAKRLRALLEAEGKTVPDPPVVASSPSPTTPDDIERRAAQIADQRAREQQIAAESARVMQEGAKAFGADKWEAARSDFIGNFGEELKARPEFFDAIFGVENGHKVFYDLANNPDEAARVLSLSPARIGVEVAHLAAKEAPARRESSVPKPISPISGTARVSKSVLDDDISMDDFIAKREEQVRARRAR